MDKKIRVKRKYSRPNPLFEKWLTEWKEEAAKKGLKSHNTFAKALKSLKKYPLPLSNGKEAKVLEHFGDKICSMLDDRLSQHQSEEAVSCDIGSQSDSVPPFSGDGSLPPSLSRDSDSLSNATHRNKCAPPADVIPCHSQLGTKFFQFQVSSNDIPKRSSEMNDPTEEQFSLNPGCFEVVLCVDNCETSSSGCRKSKAQFLLELKKHGVDFDVRKLNVGDFLWVAREKVEYSTSGSCRELVLDFVVERKRMDDLAHSIKDGRFREQKFRLRNCGLHRPVYLVEAHRSNYYGLPESTLEQAIVNTEVVDGFLVRRTKGTKDSVEYLSLMTRYLQNTYQSLTLVSGSRKEVQIPNSPANICMTFKEFNSASVKNKRLKVSEMFAKHLLQFYGLSVDRAAAIVEKYQTPFKLFEAYHSCSSEEERMKMLSTLKFGKYQKNIGIALSKTIHQLYCTSDQLP